MAFMNLDQLTAESEYSNGNKVDDIKNFKVNMDGVDQEKMDAFCKNDED